MVGERSLMTKVPPTQLKRYLPVLVGVLFLAGLYLARLYSYLLFHSVVEIASVVIAFGVFTIAWNSRRFLENGYLLALGIAYLFVGSLDFVHTLAYKGMGVFPRYDANLSTQLWIAARYVESLSFLIAPLYLVGKAKVGRLLAGYAIVALLLLASIFPLGIFPTCFVEGEGLTPFKVTSEYVICLILLISAGILYAKRIYFDALVWRLVVASIAMTICSELAFTLYADVYGTANLVGHFLKLLSFYLIYRGIVVTGLSQPWEASSESEANLRAFINGTQDAICIRDRELRLVLWNHAFAARVKTLFGVDVRVGMRPEDYMPREILAGFEPYRGLLNMVLAGEEQRTEFEYPRPDGETNFYEISWSPIRIGGQVIGASEVTRNITEQRHVERSLREAELRYRTVAEFTHDWEYWEGADGTMQYVSPSCEGVTGYTPQELVDDPGLLEAMVHPDDSGIWANHRCEVFKELKPRHAEFRILRKDGNVRWIEHACQPVTTEDGVFLGFRASNRDITIRKEREAEARELREQLAHVTRASSLGALSAALAHELNQPLAAILSNAQAAQRFLAAEEPSIDDVREALADIVADDRRAGEIIRRLRSLLQRGDREESLVNVNDVVDETVSMLRSEAIIEGVSIKTDLAESLPPVLGDRVQLQQVFLNLMINAVEAMRDVAVDEREISVRTLDKDAERMEIAVEDRGVGLGEETVERMFEPLFTTKDHGLGMGLSICRSIVEAHGGQMWADNNPERGATFHVVLPAGEERANE